MDDIVEALALGNVTGVKIVLGSVVTALAIYQAVLMAVVYGKLRLPFLHGRGASASHRAIGDTAAALAVLVAAMCLGYFGIEDGDGRRGVVHVVSAVLLLGVLALKITVVRRWHRLGRHLPVLGSLVLALFVLTWLTSAGAFLLGG